MRPNRLVETSGQYRWGAINAVSPVKRWRVWWLKVVLWYGRQTDFSIRNLIEMRVIALARVTLLPNAKRPRYLLFETNWSGAGQSYIADFAVILPSNWRFIFNNVKSFPGPLPVTGLLEWVDEVDWGTDHYWSDYREDASTQTILRALELQPQLEELIEQTRGAAPDQFALEWRRFTTKVQDLL